jgi:hypothetical protein
VAAVYGDWMVPGFAYRSARHLLRRLGWTLPKYPRGFPPFARTGSFVRRRLRGTRFAFYTYAMIGAVGEKKPGV